ncbi:hypothetical protein [Ornithinimicrobium pekingense]|nr:hypothetical protein [Ornithinimicrobium pekingense]
MGLGQEEIASCVYVLDQRVAVIRTAPDALPPVLLEQLRSDLDVEFELAEPLPGRQQRQEGALSVAGAGTNGVLVRLTGNKSWQSAAKRHGLVALVPVLNEPMMDDYEVFTLQRAPLTSSAAPESGPPTAPADLFSASVDRDLFEQLVSMPSGALTDDAGDLSVGSLRIAWELEDADTISFWVLSGEPDEVTAFRSALDAAYGE